MAQRKKKGLFGGLSAAVDGIAGEIDKAAKSVSSDIANVTINPLDHFQPGNVIIMTSRTCMKCLILDSNGVVFSNGLPAHHSNTAMQFQVISSPFSNKAYKLRNVAYPQFYLAIVNGYFIGNGQGGPECDFYGHRMFDGPLDIGEYLALESAMSPKSHVGVLPSGEFTVPAKTPRNSKAAHFKLKFIEHVKQPPPPQQLPPAQSQAYYTHPTQSSPQAYHAPPGQHSPSQFPPAQAQYPPPYTPQGYPGQPHGGYPPPTAPPQGYPQQFYPPPK